MAKKKAAVKTKKHSPPRKKIAVKLTRHEKAGRETMRNANVYDTYIRVIGLLSDDKPQSLDVLRARLQQAIAVVDEAKLSMS